MIFVCGFENSLKSAGVNNALTWHDNVHKSQKLCISKYEIFQYKIIKIIVEIFYLLNFVLV